MEDEKKGSPIWTIIIIIAVVYFGFKLFVPRWTLMMCSEVMDNGLDCQTNGTVYKDAYTSKDTCLSVGYSNLGIYPSFECGRNCKYDGNFWVCPEICNKNGVCK